MNDDTVRDDRGIARVWELGLDEGYRRRWHDVVTPNNAGTDCTDAFAEGADWGAGWLAAIITMAQAIRARTWKCPTCRCHVSIIHASCACCVSTEADAAIDAAIERGRQSHLAGDSKESG